VLTLAAVLLVRPLWLFVTQVIPNWLGWRLGHRNPPLDAREATAITWAGTRGVITLATIFAVPVTTSSGRPFPDRDLLLLCAYIVVLVTLVGQGLTFGPLVRHLGIRSDPAEDAQIRHEARLAALRAAMEAVADMQADHTLTPAVAGPLRSTLQRRADRLRDRLSLLEEADEGEVPVPPEQDALIQAQHAVIDAQREELLRWRDGGRMSDACWRQLQQELDLQERALPGGG
jgi:monovalent cation/hydrogen antiporter